MLIMKIINNENKLCSVAVASLNGLWPVLGLNMTGTFELPDLWRTKEKQYLHFTPSPLNLPIANSEDWTDTNQARKRIESRTHSLMS